MAKKYLLDEEDSDLVLDPVIVPPVDPTSDIDPDVAQEIAAAPGSTPSVAANNPWFDYATYMTNKLHRLQESNPSITANQMFKVFAEKGFGGTDGALHHFELYGADEDISPNEHFDAAYYYKAKALQIYTTEGGLTEDQVLANIDKYAMNIKGFINAKGMNAWTHYIKYGTKEGINPSNDFDTSAYMEAKLAALNAAGGEFTMDDVVKAFREKGFNALSHYYRYGGKGEGEVEHGVGADDSIPEEFKVPEEEAIHVSNSKSNQSVLTKDIDVWEGSSSDDTVTGITGASDADTYTAGDTLTDPSTDDHDTLNLYVSRAMDGGVSDSVKMVNVEQINISHTAKNTEFTLDAGDINGVKQITAKVGSGSEMILDNLQSLATEVALTGKGNLTAVWDGTLLGGQEDTVGVRLSSAGAKAADDLFGNASVVDVSNNGQIEGVSLTTTGTNYAVLDAGNAATVTVTGDGQNFLQFRGGAGKPLTVSAEEAEGGQTLDFSLQNRAETVIGSAQDDTFIFGSRLNANDGISGGDGTDTVKTNMTSSVGVMLGVENMVVTNVPSIASFDGSTVSDLATLTIENEAANATFKNMNPELVAMHLNMSSTPSKTSISFRTPETGEKAQSLTVTVGQDNADGTGTGQTFGGLAFENVENVILASFADPDNAGGILNTVGDIEGKGVTGLTLFSTPMASLHTGTLDLDEATTLALGAVTGTSLMVDGLADVAKVEDYHVTVEDGAAVTVTGGANTASLKSFTLEAGDKATVDHQGEFTQAASLTDVTITLGNLVNVAQDPITHISTISGFNTTDGKLSSYTFTADMLSSDLTLGDVTADSIGSISIAIGTQASHGLNPQTFTVNSVDSLSLSAGDGGFLNETITGGAESSVKEVNVDGAGTVELAISASTIADVNAIKSTGIFNLALDNATGETNISLGLGISTVDGASGNVETYNFNANGDAFAITNFSGAEDVLNFSAILGNNTPALIGGDNGEAVIDTLTGNNTGESIALDNHVFMLGDAVDVIALMSTGDGFSLSAGEHAVMLTGTNDVGEELKAYVLTGNGDDTVSVATDYEEIGTVGVVDAALTADDILTA